MQKLIRLGLRLVLAVGVLAVSMLVGALLYTAVVTAPFRFGEAEATPVERVAVVFGAGIRGDRPSRILADRIEAAVALYRLGRVDRLLMTGDNSSSDYDEVTVMRRYAVLLGVDPADITLDYAGFSTYESCYRLQPIFGVQRVVLVTQQYHLPRAVYTCRALGVEAVGLGTPDWGRYREAILVRYTFREALATTKALIDVHVTRPLPTFLGPYEGIE